MWINEVSPNALLLDNTATRKQFIYILIFLFFRNNAFLAIDVILLTVTVIFAVSAMIVLCAGWAVTCITYEK